MTEFLHGGEVPEPPFVQLPALSEQQLLPLSSCREGDRVQLDDVLRIYQSNGVPVLSIDSGTVLTIRQATNGMVCLQSGGNTVWLDPSAKIPGRILFNN